jgi:ABC-type sugar transport system ATPase subunit
MFGATSHRTFAACQAAISKSWYWPEQLIAENPTRGLDIRATHDIHERLKAAARGGAAVVMYSSDLDEVLEMADRVLVMHDGEVRECEKSRDRVGAAMLGVR